MKVLFLFSLILFLPINVPGAESPVVTLAPVFVTSTRTEIPLELVTASATVITADDLEALQAKTVLDALRYCTRAGCGPIRFAWHQYDDIRSRLRVGPCFGSPRRRRSQ